MVVSLNRNNANLKFVCIAATPYVLLLYLFTKTIEEIGSTLFVLGDSFPKPIADRLPNAVLIKANYKNNIQRCLRVVRDRVAFNNKYPKVKKLPLYGVDHTYMSDVLIGGGRIILIEDGLALYNPPVIKRSYITILLKKCFVLVTEPFGRNNHCDTIIYTAMRDLNINKELIKVDLKKEWEKDSQRKLFIKNLFDIVEEDLMRFRNKDVIIITQPLADYGIMSEEKAIDMYKSCIKGHEEDRVIIKTHPHDNTDYKHYFPNIDVFFKPLPLEILSLFGIKFKEAYTYNSTAIFLLQDCHKVILKND